MQQTTLLILQKILLILLSITMAIAMLVSMYFIITHIIEIAIP